MKSYDVNDNKGNYVANFISRGHAIGFCHVLGVGFENIVEKTKECNCKKEVSESTIENLNNG